MSGTSIRRLAVWLSVALSFTTLLVILGRTSSQIDPTITSSKPSGTRLFSQLLEANGLRVQQNRNQVPQLKDQEVAIAFMKIRDGSPDWPGDEPSMDGLPGGSTIRSSLAREVKAGKRLILFYVNDNFNQSTLSAKSPLDIANSFAPKSPSYRVDADLGMSNEVHPLSYDASTRDPLPVWVPKSQSVPLVSYEIMGKGLVVHVLDGIGVTNRFIDKHQNAAFYTQLVKSVAGERSTVTFAEASFGNIADDGLISALGGWARAAVWQGFLLFGVIAWSFAVGFGSPYLDRRRQSGTRDLMEAFAQLLKRAKNRPMALNEVAGAIENDLRRMVGLSRSASIDLLRQRAPAGIVDRLQAIRLSATNSKDPVALAELDNLRREIREYGRSAARNARLPERPR